MKYKIIKITGISLALLLNTISFCMQNENKQQRELMFRKILETKKNEICTLPEHKAAQKKYQQFLQEIEEARLFRHNLGESPPRGLQAPRYHQ